jgi:hypothetical protein
MSTDADPGQICCFAVPRFALAEVISNTSVVCQLEKNRCRHITWSLHHRLQVRLLRAAVAIDTLRSSSKAME